MHIIRDINEIESIFPHPIPNPCVTIGNFDGIHKGHQQLFRKVVNKAKQQNGTSIVITFAPHPLQVLRPDGIAMISNQEQKEECIRQAGIDLLLTISFTREFAKTDAKDFVYNFLVEKLGTSKLIVGYDYAFGKGREGTIDFLKRQGELHGFSVEIMSPFYLHGEIVSSTRIRKLVHAGKMQEAADCLGRPYQIRGIVQHGKKRGSTEIGFPTANLHFHKNDLIPKEGVYAVQVGSDEQIYGGVLNIGKNPTFKEKKLVAETHIFDFHQDIYGKKITLYLHKYLREEVQFSSIDTLIAQIADDAAQAKEYINLL